MSKINLKTKLYNLENTVYSHHIKGIKNDNKLVYKENNIMVTLEILNNQIKIERKCDEYTLRMDFRESLTTPLIYDIKGVGNTKLNIKTKKIEIKNNNIFIKYELIDSKEIYYYELSYEVI